MKIFDTMITYIGISCQKFGKTKIFKQEKYIINRGKKERRREDLKRTPTQADVHD